VVVRGVAEKWLGRRTPVGLACETGSAVNGVGGDFLLVIIPARVNLAAKSNQIVLMEIIFNCPKCNQELSVDGAGAGTELPCPTCGESITIPQEPSKSVPTDQPPEMHAPRLAPSAIASSAAAKVEFHLKVPVRDKPSESLIKKSAVPLDAVAKGADKQIRVRTMRHDKCIDAGHDKFDEMTTKVLAEIGEHNIISMHVINFEHFDVQTQKIMTDFGLVIVYRG
jgi:predicted RNA-binding Zn-ribbon protein involved in translation (DUF1610 family)